MRTTVTLDDDVAERLERLAHRRRATFKETLNAVLRRGLAAQGAAKEEEFVVEPFDTGLAPGVDPLRLNQLVDELAIEDFTGGGRSR
jgi:predicted transcriptional regulator